MEPQVQKLAITALVGLLLLFPVFNQVQATSLEALRDADHQAKFKDLFKDWGDIPEDEKLSYWDGRNKPPGSGDFDRNRVDDDARFREPEPGEPTEGDRDGDGVPDDQDPDPDDPNVTDDVQARRETVELWHFSGDGLERRNTETLNGPAEVSMYESVDVTWDYSGFTGRGEFELRGEGGTFWTLDVRNGSPYAVSASDNDSESEPEVPATGLEVHYDYAPIGEPANFEIHVTGTYVVYEPKNADTGG